VPVATFKGAASRSQVLGNGVWVVIGMIGLVGPLGL
jgi:hypothetical protein